MEQEVQLMRSLSFLLFPQTLYRAKILGLQKEFVMFYLHITHLSKKRRSVLLSVHVIVTHNGQALQRYKGIDILEVVVDFVGDNLAIKGDCDSLAHVFE